MDGHGERSQHPDGTAQPGRQDSFLGSVITLGVMVGIPWLAFQPFFSLVTLHAAPQPQLVYGGVTYAVAMVAALLRGVVSKLPLEILRLVAVSVVVSFLTFPPMMGSWCIALAVNHLVGWGMDGRGAIFMGVLLWGAFALVVIAIERRTTAQV